MKWPWNKIPQVVLPLPVVATVPKQQNRAGIKNISSTHDFRIVDPEYKPELDGDDPRWGRIDVKCFYCQEERRIGAPINEVNRTRGCTRGGDTKLRRGDMLVVENSYVETFQQWFGDKVLTHSLGNTGYHTYDIKDVKVQTDIGDIAVTEEMK